jgi:hypothetical protein
MNMIHRLVLSLVDQTSSTVTCRSCKSAIARDDEFGRSEGVCAPCRR